MPLELDGRLFAGGRSRFLDAGSTPETTPKIFVKVLPAALPVPILAQLDTGAAWTVLHAEIADALGLFERTGPTVAVSTRGGVFHGNRVRLPLTLVADEGESFEVDATLFVCRDWSHGNFLGYGGLLERVRFAIDPFTNDFYFAVAMGVVK